MKTREGSIVVSIRPCQGWDTGSNPVLRISTKCYEQDSNMLKNQKVFGTSRFACGIPSFAPPVLVDESPVPLWVTFVNVLRQTHTDVRSFKTSFEVSLQSSL